LGDLVAREGRASYLLGQVLGEFAWEAWLLGREEYRTSLAKCFVSLDR
jgi:hypothetical protein